MSILKSSIQFAPHFDGKRFYNPGGRQARGLKDVLRWKRTSRAERSPKFVDDVIESVPPHSVDAGRVRATLVNHSTVLLQQHGLNVLTDPIWSERASPVKWLGPRRHRKPGVRIEDLPCLDVVLISHNHYDHLDMPTLRRLKSMQSPVFIAPLGVADFLRHKGIERVHEVDWGDAVAVKDATVHCVPALHFSARGISDRNKTLWCGYVIESQDRIVYFSADTAFGDHFSQIREGFGSPDVTFLPIGAYAPRWFMSPVHMAPEDAVRAHEILGSKVSVAIHHGTFQLGDDAVDTPAELLAQTGRPDGFVLLKNGESIEEGFSLRDR